MDISATDTKKADYQKAYGRDYFEVFIDSQKQERGVNFAHYFKIIKEIKPSISSILDLGCGQGVFLQICEDNGIKKLYGIDVSNYALKTAKERTSVELKQIDLEGAKLPFNKGSFDLVVAMDVVEHFKHTGELFKETYRVLKRGGLFFLTTENSGSLFDKLFSPFYPRHEVHVNLQKEVYWRGQLRQVGFKDIMARGIVLHGFPPPLNFRNWLRKHNVPVVVQPIFSPLRTFSGTLVIHARKQ